MKLSEIYFKNFLLLGNGKLNFKKGFNAITGETGAGKSMLIGIINLLRGEHIQWDRFNTKENVEISGIFEKDNKEEIIVKRLIVPKSKRSRFLINDSPVVRETVIKEIGSFIEISSQHEQSSLLNEASHIDYYDILAGLLNERKAYQKVYKNFIQLKKELGIEQKRLQELIERKNYLQFKLNELEKLNTYEGEEKELEDTIFRLEHLESLKMAFEDGIMTFYEGEGSVYEKTSSFIRAYSDMLEKDAEGKKLLPILDNILVSSEEIFTRLQEGLSLLELDPKDLENKRERLFKIKEIMLRYGLPSTSKILEEIQHIKEQLSNLKIKEDEIEHKRKELEDCYKELKEKGNMLSKKRLAAKHHIEKKIINELKKLGFKHVQFSVMQSVSELGEKGKDRIHFYFSTTDAPPAPIKKIASGGELSRILLALKTLSLGNESEKVLIFDEIDTGIGGKTARVVGKNLKELSKYNQVIVITHLPQIASLADAHFLVKREDEEKTRIKIKELKEKERILEIARMLSGDRITDSALNHAKTLMEDKEDG